MSLIRLPAVLIDPSWKSELALSPCPRRFPGAQPVRRAAPRPASPLAAMFSSASKELKGDGARRQPLSRSRSSRAPLCACCAVATVCRLRARRRRLAAWRSLSRRRDAPRPRRLLHRQVPLPAARGARQGRHPRHQGGAPTAAGGRGIGGGAAAVHTRPRRPPPAPQPLAPARCAASRGPGPPPAGRAGVGRAGVVHVPAGRALTAARRTSGCCATAGTR